MGVLTEMGECECSYRKFLNVCVRRRETETSRPLLIEKSISYSNDERGYYYEK